MDDMVNVLNDKLVLNGYTILKISNNKTLLFKSFSKYTKCIYINIIEKGIEIVVDKIFDVIYMYRGIERLLISNKKFSNIYDSIKHIQKNIAI